MCLTGICVRPSRVTDNPEFRSVWSQLHVMKFLLHTVVEIGLGLCESWLPALAQGERIAIFACRITIYVFSMGALLINQIRCCFVAQALVVPSA